MIIMGWTETRGPYFNESFKSKSTDVAILLSIYAVGELEGKLEICGSIWPGGIKEVLEKSLIHVAIGNNQNKFEGPQ